MDNASAPRTNVFLVEDSAPIRARLSEMLGNLAGVTIVGEAGSPASAIDGILRTQPDSVVLDLHLDGGTGIEVLRRTCPVAPHIVFIMLTNHSGSRNTARSACKTARRISSTNRPNSARSRKSLPAWAECTDRGIFNEHKKGGYHANYCGLTRCSGTPEFECPAFHRWLRASRPGFRHVPDLRVARAVHSGRAGAARNRPAKFHHQPQAPAQARRLPIPHGQRVAVDLSRCAPAFSRAACCTTTAASK